jgi:hypothetical protein
MLRVGVDSRPEAANQAKMVKCSTAMKVQMRLGTNVPAWICCGSHSRLNSRSRSRCATTLNQLPGSLLPGRDFRQLPRRALNDPIGTPFVPARLRRRHVALDCIFKELRVRLDVQRLHHAVLVKSDCPGLNVNDICHFLHRHSFGQ